MKLNILTNGFVQPNTRSLLFPLILHRKYLLQNGIKYELFDNLNNYIFDCDCLIIESNYHGKRWELGTEKIISEFEDINRKVDVLHYFDMSDSTALLHPEVLPFVSGYYKAQVLNNLNEYLKPHYGNRIFTNFVHVNYGIEDKNPSISNVVKNSEDVNKIRLSWNSGYSNYSYTGKYFNEMYRKLNFQCFLKYPKKFYSPHLYRKNDISCRINTQYERDTVAWYRKKAKAILADKIKVNRIKPIQYYQELKESKLVVSPYAWGEINYKDYESFIYGALLIKPDMSHLKTWPNYYIDSETYLSYKWDASNLLDVVEDAVLNYKKYKYIAEAAQNKYHDMLFSDDAVAEFVTRLNAIILNSYNHE